jgi:hypothetical protein
MNQLESCEAQFDAVNRFFGELANRDARLRYEAEEEALAA